MTQPDLFAAMRPADPGETRAPRRGKKTLLWWEQPFETRAKIMEKIAADYEAEIQDWESRGYPDQAQDRRKRADHLRALAQRIRDERRPLA